MSFKYLQGRQLNHFPGQPVPVPDHSFSKEIIPNIQSRPPPMQLEAIASHPISCYLGEETNTHLTTTSFQVVVESSKVSPKSPLLQIKQPQFPEPLLKTCALDPSTALLPFSGHAPAPQCLSCSEGPKTKHSTPGTTSPVLSTGARSRPYSC